MIHAALLAVLLGSPAHPHGAPPADYAGAVTAREMLVLTLGNDLRTYRRASGRAPLPEADQAFRASVGLVGRGVVWQPGGGWVLQPGARTQHRDWRYAGHRRARAGLAPAPVQGVGPDVSHFLAKWPVFLRAMRDAAVPGSAEAGRVRRWELGVVEQLRDDVVTPPSSPGDAYVFTTFMDGTDGVFRLGHNGRGPGWGYSAGAFSVVPYYAPIALLQHPFLTEMYGYLDAHDVRRDLVRVVGQDSPAAPARTLERGRALVAVSAELDVRGARPLSPAARQAFLTRVRPGLVNRTSWQGQGAYQGGISRQLFLHAAFWHDEQALLDAFRDHLTDFAARAPRRWPNTSAYHRLHQLVLASRYLALSQTAGRHAPVPGLAAFVEAEFLRLWRGDGETVVSNTGWGEPAFTSYREWVAWKTERAARWR